MCGSRVKEEKMIKRQGLNVLQETMKALIPKEKMRFISFEVVTKDNAT